MVFLLLLSELCLELPELVCAGRRRRLPQPQVSQGVVPDVSVRSSRHRSLVSFKNHIWYCTDDHFPEKAGSIDMRFWRLNFVFCG